MSTSSALYIAAADNPDESLIKTHRATAAWALGVLFLALSLPNHLYPGYVWYDYPV